jgi:hypothetical protein
MGENEVLGEEPASVPLNLPDLSIIFFTVSLFLEMFNSILHIETAVFQITFQGFADDESLKFLMSGSFFYVWLLAFCWVGEYLTEQVMILLTEPL